MIPKGHDAEFKLIEKRKELESQLDLVLNPMRKEMKKVLIKNIFFLIEEQDKECFRLLKKRAQWNLSGIVGISITAELHDLIDELTGFSEDDLKGDLK